MDPHFPEYLAAVAGMNDLYGEAGDDHPTEFHDAAGQVSAAVTEAESMLPADAAVVGGIPDPVAVAAPSWII